MGINDIYGRSNSGRNGTVTPQYIDAVQKSCALIRQFTGTGREFQAEC
ncbi:MULTISPECIES: hypothetical protein [unclassified Snodgrassella]|nr:MULTISPECIES: hypothetical protein [unclassified Snodgrassella]MBI0097914.1 hypothetical protein [Snodgrassella sp. W8134]MBI0101704.1 hypothetical protein [Snodgrassella sp. W8135]